MSASCTATRWNIHGGTSSCERARRVHRIACRSGTSSVCTNRLLKAGCSSSEIADASTTSAYVVISIVRGLRDWLLTCRRRSSMRSEEHTSELQSLMRISYAVFCLKKKSRHRWSRDSGLGDGDTAAQD